MVYSALSNSDEELRQAPYRVLADWQEEHEGNLRIILPDTYGTEGFLKNAPDWLAGWTGIRIDPGDPAKGQRSRSAGGKSAARTRGRSRHLRTGWTSTDRGAYAQFNGRVRVSSAGERC